MLFGYSIDEGPVRVVDLCAGEPIPEEVLSALTDDSVTKWAHNAAFERVCLSRWLRQHYPERFVSYSIPEDTVGNYLDPATWCCSMVWSAYMGLPLSLKDVGAILKLDEQKLSKGKDLVRYFCTPCKPTIANGGRTRNRPADDPVKWALFKKYNARDVCFRVSTHVRFIGGLPKGDILRQSHNDCPCLKIAVSDCWRPRISADFCRLHLPSVHD